ncbi:hypothetical protein G6M12_07110 [Agrobacterium tumefaciens]|nr:hypothetical protein [Agrobacterium tumefaciens]
MFTSWDDLGNPEMPGIYYSDRFGVKVDVQQKNIVAFKQQRDAKFKLIQYQTWDDSETWNVGSQIS